jgi:AbrB family looped-hinge helix DNA binding protein
VIPKNVREMLNINTGDTLVVVTKHDVAVGLVKMDDVEKIATYIQQEVESYKMQGRSCK